MKTLLTCAILISLCFPAFAGIAMDFHHHFTRAAMMFPVAEGMNRDYIVKLQMAAGVEKSALISDSYRMANGSPVRLQKHKELVDFLAMNGDRFIGICSLNVMWDDAVEFAKKCVETDLIKGVKIHFNKDRQSLQDIVVRTAFQKVLEILKERPIFYLIHFNFSQGSLEEAREIFSLASNYQRQNFIIAHAAENHSEVLAHIGEAFKTAPKLRHNVYAEISTSFNVSNFFPNNAESMTRDWKTFGVGHLLFGSDFPVGSPASTLRSLESSGLEAEVIEGIKTLNAKEFFDSLSGTSIANTPPT